LRFRLQELEELNVTSKSRGTKFIPQAVADSARHAARHAFNPAIVQQLWPLPGSGSFANGSSNLPTLGLTQVAAMFKPASATVSPITRME